MLIPDDWMDYELLDAGNGERLERWGRYVLRRPEPKAIWPILGPSPAWDQIDAEYEYAPRGDGYWRMRRRISERWPIDYRAFSFYVHLVRSQHMGIYPEQAVHWNWIHERIRAERRRVRVLNLYAYSGCASIAASSAGAEVVHIDADRQMLLHARQNMALSGMGSAGARCLADDVFRFVEREYHRNSHYDAILIDLPTLGYAGYTERNGGWAPGEVWVNLNRLIAACARILSNQPLFMLVQSGGADFSPVLTSNLLALFIQSKYPGRVTTGDTGLRISAAPELTLPCGSFARWEAE